MCKFGVRCTFAHSKEELQERPPEPPRYDYGTNQDEQEEEEEPLEDLQLMDIHESSLFKIPSEKTKKAAESAYAKLIDCVRKESSMSKLPSILQPKLVEIGAKDKIESENKNGNNKKQSDINEEEETFEEVKVRKMQVIKK